MRAMILAAGKGTRLRSINKDTAKVLLPVNSVPLLEHTLLWLSKNSITEVAINLHYLGKQVEKFVGDGSAFGVQITFSREETLLGTAGGVKRVGKFLSDPFLVAYGDVLTNIDIKPLEAFHKDKKASVALVLCPNNSRQDVGVVQIDKQDRIQAFSEKPSVLGEETPFMSGGIYIMNKEILGLIPADRYYDFGLDLFPILMAQGYAIFGYPLKEDGYLLDIGTPRRYQQANRDAEAGIIEMLRR